MTRIYVACGGSSTFNGIYDGDNFDTTFTKPNDIFGTIGAIYLTNSGTTWQLINNQNSLVLYTLLTSVNPSLPISYDSWSAVNGIAPAIKTYAYNWSTQVNGSYVFNKIIITGAGTEGGTSDINGTYTYATDDYGHSFLNSNNLFRIVQTYNQWKIYPVGGTDEYYTFGGSASEPPISDGAGTGDVWTVSTYGDSGIISTLDMSDTCGTGTSSYTTNVFVGMTNNKARVLKRGNNFYIRGVDIP
jgi:hypothetical protein